MKELFYWVIDIFLLRLHSLCMVIIEIIIAVVVVNLLINYLDL